MQPIQYFAYGSNMLRARLVAREVILLDTGRAARAVGYTLKFNKKSDDGSAKANLIRQSGSIAWGVLFSVNPDSLTHLDAAEGAPNHYRKHTIRVKVGDVEHEAMTYLAQPDKLLDAPASPYDWYLALILAGARAHPEIPSSYIEKLAACTRSKPDTKMPSRRTFSNAITVLATAGYSNWRDALHLRSSAPTAANGFEL